eukprot:749240-Hanusia_phi.AAC.1
MEKLHQHEPRAMWRLHGSTESQGEDEQEKRRDLFDRLVRLLLRVAELLWTQSSSQSSTATKGSERVSLPLLSTSAPCFPFSLSRASRAKAKLDISYRLSRVARFCWG